MPGATADDAGRPRRASHSGLTGGYLKLTPDRFREPAQLVEDRLLKLARSKRGQKKAIAEASSR